MNRVLTNLSLWCFDFDSSPFHSLPSIVLKEGQSAREGGLSFVEHGSESKRPDKERKN